jgi:hypothetical protein
MVKSELVGAQPSKVSPTSNSEGGTHLIADRHRQVYSPTPIREDEVHYKVQYLFGQHFIPLDSELKPNENEWFKGVRQPNGDILLRLRTPDQ